jgi:hypothetical protein
MTKIKSTTVSFIHELPLVVNPRDKKKILQGFALIVLANYTSLGDRVKAFKLNTEIYWFSNSL